MVIHVRSRCCRIDQARLKVRCVDPARLIQTRMRLSRMEPTHGRCVKQASGIRGGWHVADVRFTQVGRNSCRSVLFVDRSARRGVWNRRESAKLTVTSSRSMAGRYVACLFHRDPSWIAVWPERAANARNGWRSARPNACHCFAGSLHQDSFGCRLTRARVDVDVAHDRAEALGDRHGAGRASHESHKRAFCFREDGRGRHTNGNGNKQCSSTFGRLECSAGGPAERWPRWLCASAATRRRKPHEAQHGWRDVQGDPLRFVMGS